MMKKKESEKENVTPEKLPADFMNDRKIPYTTRQRMWCDHKKGE